MKKPADMDKIFEKVSGNTPKRPISAVDQPSESRQEPTLSDRVEFVKMTVRVDKRQRDRLETVARNEGRLLSEVVREAIRDYLRGAGA